MEGRDHLFRVLNVCYDMTFISCIDMKCKGTNDRLNV